MRDHAAGRGTSPGDGRLSPRYVAFLVGAATVILIVGALLRPKEKQQAAAAPMNELATLPELSQRRMLRDMAGYVGERAAAVAPSVVYFRPTGTSGLIVGRDTVLTVVGPASASAARAGGRRTDVTSPTPSFLLRPAGSPALPAVRVIGADSVTFGWSFVVARAGDGRTLTLAGMTGGLVPVRCGELALHELVFDAPVPAAFGGGGMFDVDGNALALAVPCGGRVALVPLADVGRALEQQRTLTYRVWMRYGFRAAAPDSSTRRALGTDGGLVVTEVATGGAADRAGLRPGDVIGQAGAAVMSSAAGAVDLAALLEPLLAAPEESRLGVRRANGVASLRVTPAAAPERGIGLATEFVGGRAVTSMARVEAGSRPAEAGLRAGDRVVRIGHAEWPAPAAVRRALADTTPVYIVYERDGRRRGAVLR